MFEKAGSECLFAMAAVPIARTITTAALILAKIFLGFFIFLALRFSTSFGVLARPVQVRSPEGLSTS
jgi:uncharacterized membrane protein YoaT (DUF817 family)